MIEIGSVRTIAFGPAEYGELLEHARRKLSGEYLPGEEAERKAYGLLGGRWQQDCLQVTHVFPLRGNQRSEPQFRPAIDGLMTEFAVPSETPMERRGWVAHPDEVGGAEQACDSAGAMIFGSYHMHRVPWSHDAVRDTCTELDTRLAEGSGMWMLILSMVDPDHPVLRAFFEGRNEHEATVCSWPADG
ncbi:MAG: hypothetical protein GEU83_19240 [Pseudonocardiaceae bacterium]|nr:hypothetical protein [Pseudonocardiaceae bacterium]